MRRSDDAAQGQLWPEQQPQEPPVETMDVVVERVIFQAPDSGYTVLEVRLEGGQIERAVGYMGHAIPGERLRLSGRWQIHQRFGRQFRFDDYQLLRAATLDGLREYLAQAIPGVGPATARKIVEHFGEATMEALDEGPKRLAEVPGIGRKKAEAICEAWREKRAVAELMVYLRSRGLSPALANRVYQAYGSRAVEVIEQDPYRLAREIRGIGFHTADRIARELGISPDDPSRIQAGIIHTLREAARDGHMYLPRDVLVEASAELLEVGGEAVDAQLRLLCQGGDIVEEEAPDGEVGCYLPAYYDCENEVAWRLLEIAAAEPLRRPPEKSARRFLEHFQRYSDLELNDEQFHAALQTLESTASIITGGPGTGKTTATQAIVWMWDRLGYSVALAAPTGRAAKRLEEVAGHPASTIHRLLGYQPDGTFRHGADEPLEHDLVIIDESSMVDMPLALALLRAVKPGGTVLFVGDADQLPPVGPGRFFADAVESMAVPVTRLEKIYRQAEESLIVVNAHRLLRGEGMRLPTPRTWQGEDMLWIDVEEDAERLGVDSAEVVAEKIERLVTRNLPRLGFGPEDIQVLTPMRRGPIGVAELNRRLQALLNPPEPGKAEVQRGGTVFRVGDRVLQTANNYDKGVFNGEIGRVEQIDAQGRVLVEFAIGPIVYEPEELEQLELAYALTVHKSQGSEYPACVIVVHSSHYIMLRRNLLYTALTRAQQMAVLVGNRRGLWKAIRTAPARERYSRLALRLRGDLLARPRLQAPVGQLLREDELQ